MKKQILFIALSFAASFGFKADAQVSVNVNIGAQPLWGPVGYDYVQYYYIPDIDVYYDVPRRTYVYYDGGTWVARRYLPVRYRNYDLYNGYKVVVNEPRPWIHHERYVREYARYRGHHGQPFIRDARDERYFVNPRHPQHNVWVQHHGAPPPRQVMPPRGPAQHIPPGHINNPGHRGPVPGGPGPGRGNDDRGRGDDHGHGGDRGPGGHGHGHR